MNVDMVDHHATGTDFHPVDLREMDHSVKKPFGVAIRLEKR